MRPTCPECGQKAKRQSTRYGPRYECCGLWAWGNHPLASEETHKARNAAHAAFDPIWKRGFLTRHMAYRRLQAELGLSEKECHMKVMDAATAKRVPDVARAILASLEAAEPVTP